MRRKSLQPIITVFLILVVIPATFLAYRYISEDGSGISDVRITNVTPNSATITWQTEEPTQGRVIYSTVGEESYPNLFQQLLGFGEFNVAYEDRDENREDNGGYVFDENLAEDRLFHHVTIRNLEAESNYTFRIDGSLKTFEVDENDFATKPQFDEFPEADPAYGFIYNHGSNQDPRDGIVYYRLSDAVGGDTSNIRYSDWKSATINSQSRWSGDYAYFYYDDEVFFDVNNLENSVEFNVVTESGDGADEQFVEFYRPVDDIFVNIRYIPATAQSN